ncbi:4-hydroxybenzoate polyprenyl transferase family protein [Aspergillus steynii IBT 23096]|uniref:4-hydroxybenzoate polyprenyltransferase, mitochondrial n=1 Tax=Aspergillus steynii IBT 23096 TaxID=1392250 RepID=A0A2I2GM60_9EURO|nr:4-hydroxybenzoate polyprenyl transferase family protein [Aspergillus steynii IBT 23096]PLB53968.1 4-hydroxybenzoate polyprenyl transferase family protein [Aspergillus steynii IBT 23096]
MLPPIPSATLAGSIRCHARVPRAGISYCRNLSDFRVRSHPQPRYSLASLNQQSAVCTSTTKPQPQSQSLYVSRGPKTRSVTTASPKPLDHYVPPKTGLISHLPKTWIPYAELLRLQNPIGTYCLFFPCAFSTLLATVVAQHPIAPLQVVGTTGLFFAGALIMRGAGCAVNDLLDRRFDPFVERTKFRPIARGAITPPQAVIFTGTQLLAGLGILLQFPTQCLYYGVPSLLLVGAYPLAKRVTDYPQAVLGLTFSWGAWMGFPAMGVDLLSDPSALAAATSLYLSCAAWTVFYDMVYAHMDIKDDVAAGVKSIALRHEGNAKAVLSGLAATQVGLLAAAGVAAGAGPLFYAGSCGGAAVSLAIMTARVKLRDPSNCWWWFRYGSYFTGGAITMGLFLEYLARYLEWYGEDVDGSGREDAPKVQEEL